MWRSKSVFPRLVNDTIEEGAGIVDFDVYFGMCGVEFLGLRDEGVVPGLDFEAD